MRIVRATTALLISAMAAAGTAHGWSVKRSNKTHVQICVVDEDKKPLEGVEVDCVLDYGRGRQRKCISDKNGMVSFKDNVGDCALCQFVLDEKKFYHMHLTFWPEQNGSVITGVVKRVVKPTRMVDCSFDWRMSNVVERVGVDLLIGDLMPPYGKGRHTDLYLACRGVRDGSVTGVDEDNKYYTEYWFERAESPSEFMVVEGDAGCALPTPTAAPEVMNSGGEVKFRIDRRPDSHCFEGIGDKRYILFRAVRPTGVFYGVMFAGAFKWSRNCCSGGLMYCINTNPGERIIVWTAFRERKHEWLKYLRKVYAEEDAAKTKGKSGKPEAEPDPAVAERCRRMMEDKSYSGKWECSAWGLERVSFVFDKCGLGRFEAVEGSDVFLDCRMSGWFHWTADDKGLITGRAVDGRVRGGFGTYDFALRYDCARNVMTPDRERGFFKSRVFPLPVNPRCEMKFAGDESITDAVQEFRRIMERDERMITEADGRMDAAPKKSVPSLDAFCALAVERCRGTVGLAVRRAGAPEIRVGAKDGCMWAEVLCEVERGGDAGAPPFECLAGWHGPDIAGKGAGESYFDSREFQGFAESLGRDSRWNRIVEKGAWTYEQRQYVGGVFDPGQSGGFRTLLKAAFDKWYTFPVEALEVDWAKID